jgi:hypothetical protein
MYNEKATVYIKQLIWYCNVDDEDGQTYVIANKVDDGRSFL